MENKIQIFSNVDFGELRTVQIDNEVWFVAVDVCRVLDIEDVSKAVSRLEDNDSTRIEIAHPQNPNKTLCVNAVNEFGLYDLVLGSRKKEAKAFKHWITHEVIPQIRETGSYNLLPKDLPTALRAYADEVEKNEMLKAENEMQRQVIAEYEPKVSYYDLILSSKDTMAISQIAADYGLTAQQLNKILHDERIQHKVGGQWVLYREHMHKDYTKSQTIHFKYKDGSEGSRLHTKWTQKGRIAIHLILGKRGVLALMDR